MQNISRKAEEKHLTSTLAIIENHLKHYEEESGRVLRASSAKKVFRSLFLNYIRNFYRNKERRDCCIPSDGFHVYDLAAFALLLLWVYAYLTGI